MWLAGIIKNNYDEKEKQIPSLDSKEYWGFNYVKSSPIIYMITNMTQKELPGHLQANVVEHGDGDGTPLQYSCLENPMDGGAWWAAVHRVATSQTRLRDLTFTFHFHALEKEMATHSSVLAWRIPRTQKPSGLPSMGSHRVRHDWSDLAAAAVVEQEEKGSR